MENVKNTIRHSNNYNEEGDSHGRWHDEPVNQWNANIIHWTRCISLPERYGLYMYFISPTNSSVTLYYYATSRSNYRAVAFYGISSCFLRSLQARRHVIYRTFAKRLPMLTNFSNVLSAQGRQGALNGAIDKVVIKVFQQ